MMYYIETTINLLQANFNIWMEEMNVVPQAEKNIYKAVYYFVLDKSLSRHFWMHQTHYNTSKQILMCGLKQERKNDAACFFPEMSPVSPVGSLLYLSQKDFCTSGKGEITENSLILCNSVWKINLSGTLCDDLWWSHMGLFTFQVIINQLQCSTFSTHSYAFVQCSWYRNHTLHGTKVWRKLRSSRKHQHQKSNTSIWNPLSAAQHVMLCETSCTKLANIQATGKAQIQLSDDSPQETDRNSLLIPEGVETLETSAMHST